MWVGQFSPLKWVKSSVLLTEEDLQDPHRFAWMEGEPLSGKAFFSHFHEEHEPDMRAWLDRVRRGR
jgi:hypothetical protein